MVSFADSSLEEARLTKDRTYIDASLQIRRAVLENTPPGHPKRLATLTTLAISLDLLSQISGELAPLKEAIHWHAEALCMCPPGHAGRADVLSNLASSLNRRRKMTMDPALHDGAIEPKEGASIEQDILAPLPKEENATPAVPGTWLRRCNCGQKADCALRPGQRGR